MLGTRLTISVVFFLSGIAGLIYEVVWAKHLSLLFGNTAQAYTFVLATFLGGLAGGYAYFGKIADRKANPLRLYAWMEVAIGFWGSLSILFFQWFGSAYFSLASHYGPESLGAACLKLGFSALVIFPPTFIMGGTLPVLSRFSVRSLAEVEATIGWLYFLNSLGAAAGSLLAGFLLIPAYGLNLSIIAAAGLNLGIGFAAFMMQTGRETGLSNASVGRDRDKVSQTLYTRLQVVTAVVGIGLSGIAALFYEVAWIRLLSLVIGSSVYSFSLMLAAFVAGIALGGLVVGRGWLLKVNAVAAFAGAELGVALAIILTLPLYERLPYYFALYAGSLLRVAGSFWLFQLCQFFVCFALMLLPTFFLGMALPLASQIASRAFRDVGQSVGEVFAANTAGTIIGAGAAGLVLLPLLGIKGLIELGVLINLLVGSTALALGPSVAWAFKALVMGLSAVVFGA